MGDEGGAAGGGMPGMPQPPPGTVMVSPEDKAKITALKELSGVSEMAAAQAYFACDKNEELAANYLFEHGADFDAMDQGEEGNAQDGAGGQT
eukprot:NODE_2598_length_461_cov_247.342233_g2152_i0.p3 GENE.NODE_2598_length_461_cov_247.342233_g2152_i0~~NODE_2598_length_461_cov_247.342233_g2152_i0.p3  ORF type:complete len:92 (+),score=28.76 NODE_2598_length_461_cov_247.342233_g2152_i0:31-306(+)